MVSLLFLVCSIYGVAYLQMRAERKNRIFVTALLVMLGLLSLALQAQNLARHQDATSHQPPQDATRTPPATMPPTSTSHQPGQLTTSTKRPPATSRHQPTSHDAATSHQLRRRRRHQDATSHLAHATPPATSYAPATSYQLATGRLVTVPLLHFTERGGGGGQMERRRFERTVLTGAKLVFHCPQLHRQRY